VARGTFSKPIVAVARNLRKLYIYGAAHGLDALSKNDRAKFSVHIVDDPQGAYESKVKPWKNTKDQRFAMLQHDCGEIGSA
jgi:hypothetical protein